MIAAKIKISILYLDINIIHGNADTKLAKDAPIPIDINNAGKAQQIKVLKLVNKLKDGENNCLIILFFTVNLFNIISRISNNLSDYVII